MKLIEAMKLIKEQQEKAQDLREKVKKHCADLDFETAPYGADQKEQISKWIQSHSDILKKILELRVNIQRTNLATTVEMDIDGKHVSKTIAEWIHRRRDLATSEMAMWAGLTDRALQEGKLPSSQGGEARDVKIRRYYDPAERDRNIMLYKTEPGIIDRTLEVVNATTELIAA